MGFTRLSIWVGKLQVESTGSKCGWIYRKLAVQLHRKIAINAYQMDYLRLIALWLCTWGLALSACFLQALKATQTDNVEWEKNPPHFMRQVRHTVIFPQLKGLVRRMHARTWSSFSYPVSVIWSHVYDCPRRRFGSNNTNELFKGSNYNILIRDHI